MESANLSENAAKNLAAGEKAVALDPDLAEAYPALWRAYYPKQWLGLSGGYFDTRGTADEILYGGKPSSNGFVSEVDLNPWENTRVGVQYTAYSKFDGASGASGKNTLFVFLWMAF